MVVRKVKYIESWVRASKELPEQDEMMITKKDITETYPVVCLTRDREYVIDKRVKRFDGWHWDIHQNIIKWKRLEHDYEFALGGFNGRNGSDKLW